MIYKAAIGIILVAIMAFQGWRLDRAQKDAMQYRISYIETMEALRTLRHEWVETQKILVNREEAKNDTAQKTTTQKSTLRVLSETKADVGSWSTNRLPDDVRRLLTTSSGTGGSTEHSPGYLDAKNASSRTNRNN